MGSPQDDARREMQAAGDALAQAKARYHDAVEAFLRTTGAAHRGTSRDVLEADAQSAPRRPVKK